jgi:hypothetical protein
MSRRSRNDEADKAASSASDRARQAAARVKPVAARVKPLARSTGAAARRRAHRTRARAAPMAERTGQALQDNVAPKLSAMLSSAAQRLEPAKPPSRRWRKLAVLSMLAAAASVVAAVARSRKKPDVTTSPVEADADDMTPAAQMGDGQAKTSSDADADVNGHVPAS